MSKPLRACTEEALHGFVQQNLLKSFVKDHLLDKGEQLANSFLTDGRVASPLKKLKIKCSCFMFRLVKLKLISHLISSFHWSFHQPVL